MNFMAVEQLSFFDVHGSNMLWGHYRYWRSELWERVSPSHPFECLCSEARSLIEPAWNPARFNLIQICNLATLLALKLNNSHYFKLDDTETTC